MKIRDARATLHRFNPVLPLVSKPAGEGLRVYCEVETDDGHVGFGMAARFLCRAIPPAITEHILPAIKGMEVFDLEAIHARLTPVLSERGQMTGINLAALSCVDMALWDIIGKASGRSVAQLLGGHRDHAKMYVTFGFGAYDKDQLVEVAKNLIAKGHTRLKMLVGVSKRGLQGDAERVRHVRKAVGDDILLAIDANESLSLDEASRLCRLIEDLDIAWFEDPLHRCDARDMGALRRRTSIPISAGQMDGHSSRFREWLAHDAIDIFMPNSLYNGGITETRRVAHLAQIYNRPLSDAGGGGIFSAHHVAGFRNGAFAEMHLAVDQIERVLFKEDLEPKDGVLKIPAGPGFGVTADRDVLKDTLVKN